MVSVVWGMFVADGSGGGQIDPEYPRISPGGKGILPDLSGVPEPQNPNVRGNGSRSLCCLNYCSCGFINIYGPSIFVDLACLVKIPYKFGTNDPIYTIYY